MDMKAWPLSQAQQAPPCRDVVHPMVRTQPSKRARKALWVSTGTTWASLANGNPEGLDLIMNWWRHATSDRLRLPPKNGARVIVLIWDNIDCTLHRGNGGFRINKYTRLVQCASLVKATSRLKTGWLDLASVIGFVRAVW